MDNASREQLIEHMKKAWEGLHNKLKDDSKDGDIRQLTWLAKADYLNGELMGQQPLFGVSTVFDEPTGDEKDAALRYAPLDMETLLHCRAMLAQLMIAVQGEVVRRCNLNQKERLEN